MVALALTSKVALLTSIVPERVPLVTELTMEKRPEVTEAAGKNVDGAAGIIQNTTAKRGCAIRFEC